MKPWLIKFLYASAAVSLGVVGVGIFIHRGSSEISGTASAIDSFSESQPVVSEPQSEPESEAPEPEAVEPSPSASEPVSAPAEPVVIAVPQAPVSPATVYVPPAPAFISVPGGGGFSVPAQSAAPEVAPIVSTPVPTVETTLEISVSTPSSTPPTLSGVGAPTESVGAVASSTSPVFAPVPPEYICVVNLADLNTATVDHLVISEMFIDMVGADTQEFIKLYNPTDHDIFLASSSLQYLSATASGIDKTVKKNFSAESKIASKGFYLIGMGDYAGPPTDMTWSQSLSNTGASVFFVGNGELIAGLNDADIIDRAVYGDGTLPPVGSTLTLFNL